MCLNRDSTLHGKEGRPSHFFSLYSHSSPPDFSLSLCNVVNSNPNEPQEEKLRLTKDRNRFKGITWDPYDKKQRKYLEIGSSLFLFFSFLFFVSLPHFRYIIPIRKEWHNDITI